MYYPGTHRSRLCIPGKRMWEDFCKERGIHIEHTGKLIAGLGSNDNPILDEILSFAKQNGATECEILTQEEARKHAPRLKLEDPEAKLIWSPLTSTMNIKTANIELEKDLRDLDNVTLLLGEGLDSILSHTNEGIELYTNTDCDDTVGSKGGDSSSGQIINARAVINCAGLYSDIVSRKLGLDLDIKNCLLKGYYCRAPLNKMDSDIPKPMVYRVPFPGTEHQFSGSHTTMGNDGEAYIKLGPFGFPALWRENYRGTDRMNMKEVGDTIMGSIGLMRSKQGSFFRKLLWDQMTNLIKNTSLRGVVSSVDYMVPLRANEKAHFSWYKSCVSNYMCDKDGKWINDFMFENTKSSINVLNYNSPGWTCG